MTPEDAANNETIEQAHAEPAVQAVSARSSAAGVKTFDKLGRGSAGGSRDGSADESPDESRGKSQIRSHIRSMTGYAEARSDATAGNFT